MKYISNEHNLIRYRVKKIIIGINYLSFSIAIWEGSAFTKTEIETYLEPLCCLALRIQLTRICVQCLLIFIAVEAAQLQTMVWVVFLDNDDNMMIVMTHRLNFNSLWEMNAESETQNDKSKKYSLTLLICWSLSYGWPNLILIR